MHLFHECNIKISAFYLTINILILSFLPSIAMPVHRMPGLSKVMEMVHIVKGKILH